MWRCATLAVLASTLATLHVDAAQAAGIRGSWRGMTYEKIGGGGFSTPVIVRIAQLRAGHRAGRVIFPPIDASPMPCRGPIRYLGRSPRGGYRFLYRETNRKAVDSDDCSPASHILLVPHGSRLFIRDSDLQFSRAGIGGVDFGLLARIPG